MHLSIGWFQELILNRGHQNKDVKMNTSYLRKQYCWTLGPETYLTIAYWRMDSSFLLLDISHEDKSDTLVSVPD